MSRHPNPVVSEVSGLNTLAIDNFYPLIIYLDITPKKTADTVI